MTSSRRVDDLIASILERLRPKAKSLIVTVYGDAILPHGGSAWLGSLIRIMAAMGMNERIVRTSVFRLAKEDWLSATQIGRRSYYSLTDTGRRRFQVAQERIYAGSGRTWDRQWTLVLTGAAGGGADRREQLDRDLGWQGFGRLSPGVMVHPDPDPVAVRQSLQDAGSFAVAMRASAESWVDPGALRTLIRGCWDLDRLAADYNAFLDIFRPAWRALDGAASITPEQACVIRVLLIHGYRRALLRDPMLPDELLAADWPGAAARLLCRNLYRLLGAAAERYLMETFETADGPLPEATPAFLARFGGL
ncbi:MAG: phenylacetic acid degradation operon negative regulatory protein PaaX [Telmatospirillum sp.]|nr:phenylacetic acid degradation operon negative regulatory protein PaaX [Telmatospirillum sp.]